MLSNRLFLKVAKKTIFFGFTATVLAVVGGCVVYQAITKDDPREAETDRLLEQWSSSLLGGADYSAKLELANAVGMVNSLPTSPYLSLQDALRDDRLRRAMQSREPSWFAYAGLNTQLNKELEDLTVLGEGTAEAALHVREGIEDLYGHLVRLKKVMEERGSDEIQRSPYSALLRRLVGGHAPFHRLNAAGTMSGQSEGGFFYEADVAKWEVIRAFLKGIQAETHVESLRNVRSYPELLAEMRQWEAELDRGVGQYDFLVFIRVAPERVLPSPGVDKNQL